MYFKYGKKEIEALKSKDRKLAEVIDKIGYINRQTDPDIFASIVHNIIAQQISMKAEQTIWKKMTDTLGKVNAATVSKLSKEEIQKFGITFKKVDYILEFANKVKTGQIDLQAINKKTDEEIIKELSSLRGVGEWTIEMILLFCLERPNVFSYKDLAILRGLRMIYRHKKITKEIFEKYRQKFTPYCSIASLYLWEVSLGSIPGLTDPAQSINKTISKKKKENNNVHKQAKKKD